MAARFPYYLLADSPRAARRRRAHRRAADPRQRHRRRPQGFVYKRVPHITLKSIAQNPDIHEGNEPRRDRRGDRPSRRERAPLRRALRGPQEGPRPGPFTVESLSPAPRPAFGDGPEPPRRQTAAANGRRRPNFEQTILDNLARLASRTRQARRAARVRSARALRRQVDPGDGRVHRGRGRRTPRRDRARPGVRHSRPRPHQGGREGGDRGVGFDLLVVAASRSTRTRARGEEFRPPTTASPCRRSADSAASGCCWSDEPRPAMGEDLLKKTGAGNLFMVFGEPDIDVRGRRRRARGRDPRRRRLRPDDRRGPQSTSTDDIACWFIDTNYNGEAFFVRHAYFTGGNDPYERLRQRAHGRHRRGRMGVALLDRRAARSRSPRPARSPSRSSTTTATRS